MNSKIKTRRQAERFAIHSASTKEHNDCRTGVPNGVAVGIIATCARLHLPFDSPFHQPSIDPDSTN